MAADDTASTSLVLHQAKPGCHGKYSLGMSLEYADHPWKFVPLSLILFQLRRILGASQKPVTTSRMGVPVNLFDAMRLVLRKHRQ